MGTGGAVGRGMAVGVKFLSVLLALVAACSNATSNVLQRIANRDEVHVPTLSLRLVRDLLHRPLWFAGLGAVMLSFVLQASALRFGPLALVEPLLVCELPLTFVGAAIVLGARLGRREWASAIVMTGGLALLVYFLDPRGGARTGISPYVWTVGLGVTVAAVAALVGAGKRARGDTRAAFYGMATGIEFGLTAALMKGMVGYLSHGIVRIFSAWETYAMVVAGIVGLFLVQNALQAGKIVAAQPGITLLDPFVAILWGVFAFGERAAVDDLHLALATAGGLLMVGGALMLSRSPVLEHGHAGHHQARSAIRPRPGSPSQPRRMPSGMRDPRTTHPEAGRPARGPARAGGAYAGNRDTGATGKAGVTGDARDRRAPAVRPTCGADG